MHRPAAVVALAVLCAALACGAQTVGTGVAGATEDAAALRLAKVVDAHYNHLLSLEARYVERFQGLGMDRTESGRLTLAKPGRMRWAYDTPAGKVFLLDGKTAVAYTPGDPQATSYPEKQLDDLRSPLRLLLGHTELAKELTGLSVTPVAAGRSVLRGTPRGAQQRLRALALTVDDSGRLYGLRFEEADGAVTTFVFSEMRENIAIDAAEFRFVAPVGVTVVKGTQPL